MLAIFFAPLVPALLSARLVLTLAGEIPGPASPHLPVGTILGRCWRGAFPWGWEALGVVRVLQVAPVGLGAAVAP